MQLLSAEPTRRVMPVNTGRPLSASRVWRKPGYCTGVYGSNSWGRVTPADFGKLATGVRLRVTDANLGNSLGGLGKSPDTIVHSRSRDAENVWAYSDNATP